MKTRKAIIVLFVIFIFTILSSSVWAKVRLQVENQSSKNVEVFMMATAAPVFTVVHDLTYNVYQKSTQEIAPDYACIIRLRVNGADLFPSSDTRPKYCSNTYILRVTIRRDGTVVYH